MLKTRLAVVGAAISAAMLAAGGASAQPSGSLPTITIGEIANFTGIGAKPWGIPVDRGMQLALAEVESSGYLKGVASLRIESADDTTVVANAVTIFNQFVQKKYPVTVSSVWTPIAAAITPLANQTQTLFISPGSGGTGVDDPDYFFRMNDALGPTKTLAKFLVQQKKAVRLGLVLDGANAAFASIGNNMLAGLKEVGVSDWTVVQKIATADTDFSSVLTNLRKANVDAVAILCTPAQSGNILAQMKQFGGFDNVVKAGHFGWGRQVSDVAGAAATGALFTQPWALDVTRPDKFTAAYKARYSEDPTAYSALGHDTTWLIAVAVKMVRSSGKPVTGTTLKDVLVSAASSKDFQSWALIQGFSLAASGAPSYPGALVTFAADGSVTVVK